ncbi:MAG: hypothetical protein KGI58_01605 [Patescibacteria group bacterium]|nr:hypothetical protein [Patescibacteria group bacterium]
MKSKNILNIVSSITSSLLFIGVSMLPAYTYAAVTTTPTKAEVNAATRLTNIIAKSDEAINARIASLNKIDEKVQQMAHVSSAEKLNISNEIQTNITGLSELKSKIDSDTDAKTAHTDSSSIYGKFRIYALIIPQGYIEASADRIDTIVGMLTTISTKLQSRINSDQSEGKNVTALQNSLNDINTKIADAKTQSAAALNRVANLSPDGGDKTLLASNTASLKASRADIKLAVQDFKAIRTDVKTIIQGLKSDESNKSNNDAVTGNH